MGSPGGAAPSFGFQRKKRKKTVAVRRWDARWLCAWCRRLGWVDDKRGTITRCGKFDWFCGKLVKSSYIMKSLFFSINISRENINQTCAKSHSKLRRKARFSKDFEALPRPPLWSGVETSHPSSRPQVVMAVLCTGCSLRSPFFSFAETLSPPPPSISKFCIRPFMCWL